MTSATVIASNAIHDVFTTLMEKDRQFAGLLTMLMPELCDCKGTPECVASCRWVKFSGKALRELAPSKMRDTGDSHQPNTPNERSVKGQS